MQDVSIMWWTEQVIYDRAKRAVIPYDMLRGSSLLHKSSICWSQIWSTKKTNCHPATNTAHHSQKNWNHVLWECSSQATFIILRLSPAIIPRDLLSSPNPDLFISTDLSFILYTLQLDRYRTHYPFSALTGCKQLTTRTTTKNSQRHVSKLLLKTI